MSELARLGDHVDLLTGFPFKSTGYVDTADGVRLLRGDNIAQARIRWDGAKKWPSAEANGFDHYRLNAGDVVVAMDRPWIEAGLKYAQLRDHDVPSLLVQRVARLRAGASLDQPFLAYLIGSPSFTEHILALQTGTAVPHISGKQISEFRFPLLPIDTQRSIAAVLGALDDKIAVNERIAAIALALADTYFAARSNGLPISTETFGSVAQVFGGGTPRTSEPRFWDGAIAWTTPSDVTALGAPYLFDTSRKITDEGLRECASQLYPAGSIFMTSRATIGAFAVPQIPAAVNQGFIVLVPPNQELRWWLFHEMRARIDEMISLANGSTFLELSRKNFKSMPVRLPSASRLAQFSALVDPLHRRAAKTVEESHELARLRDELLPRLMSGEIHVRDAEEAVEDVV